MTITSSSAMAADAGNYLRSCFSVRIVKQFTTFQEITAFAEEDPDFGSGSGNDILPASKAVLADVATSSTSISGSLPQYFSQRRCRDTTLGGNDVLNPLPQFCEDDDIMHPHFYADLKGATGLGQVYKEMYDDNQQIVYMTFGLPVFNKLSYFYANAVDSSMADAMNKGTGFSLDKIGYLIGKTLSLLITLPTIPLMFLNRIYGGLTDVPITRYYEFVERMPMYIRFVNTIMVNLSVNMRILSSGWAAKTRGETSLDITQNATGSASSDAQYQTLYAEANSDKSGLPDIFSTYQIDLAQIITRKYLYEGNDLFASRVYTDEFVEDSSQEIPAPDEVAAGIATQSTNPGDQTTTSDSPTAISWTDKLVTGFKNALYRGHLYIGFRVEKGLDSTETFSNTTGESNASRALNQQFESGGMRSFDFAHGNLIGGAIGDTIGSVLGAVGSGLKGMLAGVHLDGLSAVATGAAKIDIPEVWMNSSYSKDISFTIDCRAPYGDPVSILKGEYLPTACFLAAVLPRATGQNSWTGPFIARMYSKGFFASSLCIIQSLTVERGADQNGWSHQRLPLKTTLRVNVKDLSPVMYMYMGSTLKDMESIIGANSVFNEYMMTLSGIGLTDELTPIAQMMRKAEIFGKSVWESKLNPFELGMEGGDRFIISKMISMFMPGNLLPAN